MDNYRGGNTLDLILKISIVMLVGIFGGKLAEKVKLPNVSGYLVAGLFLGPSFFTFIDAEASASLTIISDMALSIIAFSIGSEFVLQEMKKLGKKIAIITLTEVVGAVLVVFSVMFFLFHQTFAFSIVIASMSAATAPAATLLVIRQYRANGPLTKTILPVVALDDVYGIMAFGIAISLAVISVSDVEYSVWQMISKPLLEISGSLFLGVVIGVLLYAVLRRMKSNTHLQVTTLCAIGIAAGLSMWFGISPLLTNIVVGVMIVNLMKHSEKVFQSVNEFSSPIYVLFFTLAGASLDLNILSSIGIVGIAYVFSRAGGKYLGAWFGAEVMKSEPVVKKYLGWALLPQGGISIGLSVIVRQQLPAIAPAITTIIMFSILIYEVTGPIFAKIAISRANEINGMDPEKNQETAAELNQELQSA